MKKRISKIVTISLQPNVVKFLEDLTKDQNRSKYIAKLIENEYNRTKTNKEGEMSNAV